MPFTPFHLGPAIAFKALGGHRFSFMVFGGAQVLMDIEPLIGILQNKEVLHGITHTVPGALVIGLVAAVIGKPISEFVLRLCKARDVEISWLASFAGALIGTLSHILLDAVMHFDMNPLWPFVQGNALLSIISLTQLHLLCLGLGLLGLAGLGLRKIRQER
jgi:membrane-bound metal-dependent hydrolase YbcI (DUF457 family)